MSGQRGHMRFVGGTIYCPSVERRVQLDGGHRYGQEFICPGCWVRVEATDFYKKQSA